MENNIPVSDHDKQESDSLLRSGQGETGLVVLRTRGLRFQDFITYPDIEIREGSIVFIVGKSG